MIVPEQHRILPFIQGVAALALPVLLGLYVLVSIALGKFYGTFGITFDQAGINQTVLLSRMASVIVFLIIAAVVLTSIAVTCVWLTNRMTTGRLSRLLPDIWRRPACQALVVMTLVGWYYLDSRPSHLPWILGLIAVFLLTVIVIDATGEWLDAKLGGRLSTVIPKLRNGETRTWLQVTTFLGVAYSAFAWFVVAGIGTDPRLNFIEITLGRIVTGIAFWPLLIAVFFVFFIPYRILQHTRYFRLVSTTVAGLLTAIVLSQYLVTWVGNAAQTLHDEGTFTDSLRGLLGIQPQIATVQWGGGGDMLIPEDRRVLVLGQSEEALWLYDCFERRTIRVSGGAIVATRLVLDPYTELTCRPDAPTSKR